MAAGTDMGSLLALQALSQAVVMHCDTIWVIDIRCHRSTATNLPNTPFTSLNYLSKVWVSRRVQLGQPSMYGQLPIRRHASTLELHVGVAVAAQSVVACFKSDC